MWVILTLVTSNRLIDFKLEARMAFGRIGKILIGDVLLCALCASAVEKDKPRRSQSAQRKKESRLSYATICDLGALCG